MSRIDQAWRQAATGAAAAVEQPALRAVASPLDVYPFERPRPAATSVASPISATDGDSVSDSHLASECERIVRALRDARRLRGTRTVVVTRACADEPVTGLTLCLARSLADAGERVLLIDANLSRPAIHVLLGIDNEHGLADCLLGPSDAIPHVMSSYLSVLCAGPAKPRHVQALSGERFMALLAEYAGAFDWVIVDAMAVSDGATARLLACRGAGVVFAIGARTPFAVAEQAMALLGRPSIVGTVLHGIGGTVSRSTIGL